MAAVVLDASAVLALVRNEPGSEQVAEVIGRALVTVVNEAEVIGKLIWRGQTPEQAVAVVQGLPYEVVDVDRELCNQAGAWWGETKAQGLSLADRCCLALAQRERLPALTTDASWARISLPVDVRLISGRRKTRAQ